MASPELHAKDDSPLRLPVWGVDSIFGSETSSSDGFSTSFGSELGSTGTETESEDGGGGEDDDDFIAELARQMADYMLQDDEDESFEDDNGGVEVPPEYSPKFMQPCGCGYEGKWCNCNASSVCYYDNKELLESDSVTANQSAFMFNDSARPIEVYRLKNQPSVIKQGHASRGRRAKAGESTQQRKTLTDSQLEHKDAPPYGSKKGHRRGGGRGGGKANPIKNGSGMQAIFLGRSGHRSDSHSGGTGVFLPRGTNQHPTEPKKKSGCSTVLIPVRVLQALQLHFNHMDASSSSSHSNICTPNHLDHDSKKTRDLLSQGLRQATDIQLPPTNEMNTHEMQLPQEWTY